MAVIKDKTRLEDAERELKKSGARLLMRWGRMGFDELLGGLKVFREG